CGFPMADAASARRSTCCTPPRAGATRPRAASGCVPSRSPLAPRSLLSREKKPDERQPEFPRVRHWTIVDEDVGGVSAADQQEQLAQLRCLAGEVARPVTQRRAAAGLAEIGAVARQRQCPLEIRDVEPRKDQRDRERTRAGTEQ